ncbi:HEAT repeat domain-containing protein [Herpetosiphon geysericola]|uniref:HEAT repeat domain-containing protein n=1 Tax=Herpetosiphon geysericola TaxID=70996 RepID=UPI0006C934C1|nr:HEAT repeat domain-containing protein [Herpetosiphon geysericola]
MTEEQNERDIEAAIIEIGDHNRPIVLSELKVFNDLDQDEADTFEFEWTRIEPSHRRNLAQAMQEVAEASLELDFREVFSILLTDQDPAIRIAAVKGMAEDTRRSSLRRLSELLVNDADDGVRANAAITLGAWALRAGEGSLDQRTSNELAQHLWAAYDDQQTSTLVRQRLLETLGYLADSDPRVNQEIGAAYQRYDDGWQAAALCAMGRTGLDQWLPTVTNGLRSNEPLLRFEAVRAAGELGDLAESIVNHVARATADGDIEVATTAMWALGQIGGSAARRFLEQLIKEVEGVRREAAVEALKELQFFDDPMQSLPIDDDDEDEDDYWYGEDDEE